MEDYDKQKFINKWGKSRARGRLGYVLHFVLWAVPLYLTLLILLDLFEFDLLTAIKRHVFSAGQWARVLALSLFVGWFNWWWMERTYLKIKSDA